MCGIAGYIGPDDVDLDAMVSSLRRRGPDRAASLRLAAGGLGAARLEIVGDRAGDQPLRRRGEAGPTAFVMNGEVYNWTELARSIDLDTTSDSAAAHAFIDRRGPAAAAAFRGGFAFAHASAGGRRITLGRDELGLKPLFYARRGESLLFASEMRALLAAGVPAAVDEESLACLLALQFHRPGRTLFRGIRALLPGELVTVDRGGNGLRVVRERIRRTDRPEDDAATEETVRVLFDESLDLQGPRQVPAALLLSGGLDSSALALGLARRGRLPESAWVGYFPDAPAHDERPYARAAAAAAGIPLEESAISAADFGGAMAETVLALEEPVAGPGSVSQLLLCRRLAGSARVVYGGQGGDELFGGYERLRIAQALRRGDVSMIDPAYAPLRRRMAAARDRDPRDPTAAYRAAVVRGEALAPFLAPGGPRPARLGLAEVLGEEAGGDLEQDFERHVLLPGLLHVDDRTTAWHGLEGRSPFLDQRLAAALARVPLAEKSPPERPRRLFRAALGRDLPPSVAARTEKLGFPVPLARWWRGELAELAGDVLRSRASVERGIVRPDAVEALLRDDGQGGRSAFFLLMLELWHRAFIDRAAAAPPDAGEVERMVEGAA